MSNRLLQLEQRFADNLQQIVMTADINTALAPVQPDITNVGIALQQSTPKN